LLAYGRWFFPGAPASSTTKTGRHEIAEILLKVALNKINQSIKVCRLTDKNNMEKYHTVGTVPTYNRQIR
jgi:Trk K+ transport system NAD-binding subunit